MPSIIQADQLKSGDGVTTYLNSGTLSNLTFPDGHVIQTKVAPNTVQVTVDSSSWDVSHVTSAVTFTPLKANSDILLIGHVHVFTQDTYAYVDFYKNASDFTETANLSGYSDGLALTSDDQHWSHVSICHLDTMTENSVTEKTYKFSMRRHGSSGTTYLGWSTPSPEVISIFEIAR
jgi:hypothetical protein